MGLPFFGGIPLEPAVRQCWDKGEPIVSASPNSDSSRSFNAVTEELVKAVDAANQKKAEADKRAGKLKIITT